MNTRGWLKKTGRIGLLGAAVLLMGAAAWAQPVAFTGKWLTDFGELGLTISGNDVTGAYEHAGGVITGTVSDDGATLLGWWSESPTYESPDNAGAVILTLGPDGNSFTGTRWHGPSSGPGEPWNGVRFK